MKHRPFSTATILDKMTEGIYTNLAPKPTTDLSDCIMGLYAFESIPIKQDQGT